MVGKTEWSWKGMLKRIKSFNYFEKVSVKYITPVILDEQGNSFHLKSLQMQHKVNIKLI